MNLIIVTTTLVLFSVLLVRILKFFRLKTELHCILDNLNITRGIIKSLFL